MTVRIWAMQDGCGWKIVDTLSGDHSRTIRSVAWSPSGSMLATCSFDGTVCVYERNMEGGGKSSGFESIAVLEGHDNEVKCVAWSPSGSLLATSGRDKSVWVWEATPEDDDDNEIDEQEFECISICAEHTQDVKAVAWGLGPGTDGFGDEQVFSASYDNSVKVWQEQDDDWICTHTLTGHQSTVWGVSVSPLNKGIETGSGGATDRIVTCSADKSMKIWRRFTLGKSFVWREVAQLNDHASRPIFSVDWSVHTGAIASGAGDNAVRVIEQDNDNKATLSGSGTMDQAESKDRSKDVSEPEVVQEVWNIKAEVKQAHSGDVNCVRWSPVMVSSASGGGAQQSGQQLLATCGDDETVRIWMYTTGAGGSSVSENV